MAELWWFLRASWAYLGCEHGTGRWIARRRYARSVIPAWRQFHAAMEAERG